MTSASSLTRSPRRPAPAAAGGHTVGRQRLAGANHEHITHRKLLGRDLLLAPVNKPAGLLGREVEQIADGRARASERQFLDRLRQGVQEHQRGGFLPQAKDDAAGGGDQHQRLDADLALLHELLPALLGKEPRAHGDGSHERGDRDHLGHVEQLEDDAEREQQPGDQRVAQRREPVRRLEPAQPAGDLGLGLTTAVHAASRRRPRP